MDNEPQYKMKLMIHPMTPAQSVSDLSHFIIVCFVLFVM